MFLINSRLGNFNCGHSCEWRTLLLTYGRFFAEFLGDLSLVRLRLLALITCVGLRYGFYIYKFREFSRKRALLHPARSAQVTKYQVYKVYKVLREEKSLFLLYELYNFMNFTNCVPRTVFAALGNIIKDRLRIFLETSLTPRTTNPIMREAYCSPSFHRNNGKSWSINHVSIGCGSRHSLRAD